VTCPNDQSGAATVSTITIKRAELGGGPSSDGESACPCTVSARLGEAVTLVFRPVAVHPPASVFDRPARRLCGPKSLHRRQSLHPLPPSADRRMFRIEGLGFRRKAERMDHRQHEKVRERGFRTREERVPSLQLALHDLETDLDLGHRRRHDFLVRRNAELRIDIALVINVIDQVRVVVAVDRADPSVQARPLPRVFGRESICCEHIVDIGDDRASLVDREVAVSEDRHPLKWVQSQMARCVHLSFEIVKRVDHLLMGQHQPWNLHIGAAGKAGTSDMVVAMPPPDFRV